MKHFKLKKLSIYLLGIVFFAFSCKEQFTEKDALDAQQQIDMAIYVYDAGTEADSAVAGATVTFIQGIETRTVTTDETGVALFPKAKIGGYILKVTADNFTSYSRNDEIYSTNFRQGQETLQVGIYSLTGDNVATVKGRVEIELDLTNDVTEYAAGIELNLIVDLSSGDEVFTTTTDAEGRYSIDIPTKANSSSTRVEIRFPDLELNQTIVYNRLGTETGDFPEVLPAVYEYPTIFMMYDGNRKNYNNFPDFDILPMYGLAEDAPSGGTNAVISAVYTTDGVIDDLGFSNGGDYTGDADGLVTISFTSLLGGSGATLVVDLDANGYTSVSGAFFNGDYTLTGGSGYPDTFYELNRNNYEGPTIDEQDREERIYVYPGTIYVFDADYGTGVSREDDLD